MRTAVVLSGGIDSSAIAWWKKPDVAIFINYGQTPADAEESCARNVADRIGAEFSKISIDCKSIGSGSLASRDALSIAPAKEWWPFRNQLLITMAAARAVELGVKKLYFGSVSTDKFHADGRPLFFQQISSLLQSQEGELIVDTPAIELRTEELVKISEIPKDLLLITHSCHISNFPCGVCEGCIKHLAVLRILGIEY
ncbi:7-cyano-7-deazaguanine synthase [Pseudobdellovibrio exovorus]|uniref:7-cyano-7-deazaguanine synthase n=1 Tax=Pseudobdellovibrio exovorus JSS TaxID=1184267 RepID=M4V8I6_9BACT|nr:7-cyano-7-deazaguanine synthase [Pseudobdellovibrio exovorus]AGH94321.1 hypothetical protein A11Q_101 [Pseudobdellovibrio exovorus JSS]